MSKCKPVNTPMSTFEKLSAHVGEYLGPQDATSYRSIVGGLQYLTLTLDKQSLSVSTSPYNYALMAVKRILSYLKGTIHMVL